MDIPSDQQLLATIEAFLERHSMPPTRLGAEATGEPQLVSSIRGGRSPRLKLLQRISAYMRMKDVEAGFEVNSITEVSAKATEQVPA